MHFAAPVTLALVLATFAVAMASLALLLARRMRHQTHALRAATRDRDRAAAAESAAIRTLRLAAIELRAPAMTLLGYADHLTQTSPASAHRDLASHSAAIAGVTMQVLNITDDLQDHAVGEPAARVLRLESVALEPMLRDAMATIDASLGPSRRHWRLPADIVPMRLPADRRALAQILARVLGNAARLSRDDDWIDIHATWADDVLTLTVEDEGAGLPACTDAAARSSAQPASRGLGLGLALARTLMAAHGGALTVESTTQVGSRVVLTFPLRR